jgi:hypothetical protein
MPSASVAWVLRAAVALAFVLSSAAAAQDGKPVSAAAGSPELEQARTLLDKYQDPIAAVHDGYFSTLACVEYRQGGAEGSMRYMPGGMGVHFLNLQHIGPRLVLCGFSGATTCAGGALRSCAESQATCRKRAS